MISSQLPRSFLHDSPAERPNPDADERRFVPVWNGILQEFRNHLTVLMAVTSELRAEIPPALALQVGDAVVETERNVQSLTALLALADASVRTVEPLISELGEVVDRAIRLAAPAAGRRVSIVANVPRRAGVKNRGSALECLLAALLVDLARSSLARGSSRPVQRVQLDGKDHEIAHAPRIRIDAEVSRNGLAIYVESDGPRPAPGSWRSLLAADLAAKLDATLTASTEPASSAGGGEVAAFVVQFR
jgi:hypothetical protein